MAFRGTRSHMPLSKLLLADQNHMLFQGLPGTCVEGRPQRMSETTWPLEKGSWAALIMSWCSWKI